MIQAITKYQMAKGQVFMPHFLVHDEGEEREWS